MSVEDIIRKRRSVRSYQEKKVPKEKIEKVMNAVRMAPSARNKQGWKFVIVEDEEKKSEVHEYANLQDFVKEAPVLIAGIATDPDYMMSCGTPGGIVNLAIALDHLTLEAAEEGLGTCWIGSFEPEKVKEALKIPEDYKIGALMTLGYPKSPLEKKDKDRKDLDEIISYNTYSD